MKIIKEILPQQVIPEKEVTRYIMEDERICKSFDEANTYLTWNSKYMKFINDILDEKILWDKDFIKQIVKINLNPNNNIHYIISPEFTEDVNDLILSKFGRCIRDNENIKKHRNDYVIYFYLHDDSSHWQLVYVPYDYFKEVMA